MQENGKDELSGKVKAKYTKIIEERNMSPEATLEWVVHNYISHKKYKKSKRTFFRNADIVLPSWEAVEGVRPRFLLGAFG